MLGIVRGGPFGGDSPRLFFGFGGVASFSFGVAAGFRFCSGESTEGGCLGFDGVRGCGRFFLASGVAGMGCC